MKSKLRGWKKICSFAYSQSMKSKAMKITLALLAIISFISMPLTTVLSDGGDSKSEEQETPIEKVYVYDNTGILAQYFIDKSITDTMYEDIEFEKMENCDKAEELINHKDNKNAVFLEIEYIDDPMDLSYGINTYVYYGKDSEVSKDDAQDYASFVDENIKKAIYLSAKADEESLEKLMAEITYEVVSYDSEGNVIEDNSQIDMFEYYFSLAFICISIMFISMVGGKVSELIVTEKSTRVMEYILTSVKPMAVLLGKVMASTLVMITAMAAVALSFVASIVVNNIMFESENGLFAVPGALSKLVEGGALDGVTPVNILLVVVFFIAGSFFYGLLGGISGATVSKVEEMAEGMKIFTMTLTLGAYIPLFLLMTNGIGGADWGMLSYIIYLCPITSVFILPSSVCLGNVGLGILLTAILITLIAIVVLMLLVGKVYETMLYSNGAPLKIKDIIGFARTGKEEKNGK